MADIFPSGTIIYACANYHPNKEYLLCISPDCQVPKAIIYMIIQVLQRFTLICVKIHPVLTLRQGLIQGRLAT